MTAEEFWNTFPHCCGYAGGCDGDLVGLSHEESCPLSRGHEPDLFEFAEAYAKSELARVTGERDAAVAAEHAMAEQMGKLAEAAEKVEQQSEKLTAAWFIGETILPDGSLRATVEGLVDRAEAAEKALAERDERIEKLTCWLAEADFGFGGFFAFICSIEKAAKAGDMAAILKLAEGIRADQKELKLSKDPLASRYAATTPTIEDGFGSRWYAICPMCGKETMRVVRPGDARCSDCG